MTEVEADAVASQQEAADGVKSDPVAAKTMLKRVSVENAILQRRIAVDASTLSSASQIIEDVKTSGFDGFIKHAIRLGDLTEETAGKFLISRPELREAFLSIPESQQQLLLRTAKRIQSFADAQKRSLKSMQIAVPGGFAGHDISTKRTWTKASWDSKLALDFHTSQNDF